MVDKKKENSQALSTVKMNQGALSIINTMADLERIVDYVAESEIYNKAFTVNVEEDGKPIRKVDRNAIATCLMLGSELGFKPIESIMLGRRLDDKAIVKVHRGRDLGLSKIAAMQNIHVFPSGGGEAIYVGIHVVQKCLIDAGVKRDLIEDGSKPYYYYVDYKTGEPVELNELIHVVINTGIKPTDLEIELKQNKKTALLRKTGKRAIMRLTRGNEVIEIPYTLQQAIDAGLYPGKKSDGTDSKGKDNWSNHPETHLVKMSTMLGARIIIADTLLNCYIPEELPDRLIEDVHDAQVVE